MVFRVRARRVTEWVIASSIALSLGSPGVLPVQAAEQRQAQDRRPDRRVTLVTGDRVTLHEGDPSRAAVQAGPGRDQIAFSVSQAGGRLQVLPSDVVGEVSSGRLDRRLFDVTGLIEAGYDDTAASAIPLIVTYPGRTRPARKLSGATVSRELPVVNGSAVKVPKKSAGAFLRQNRSAGLKRIWLDGRRKPVLDQSVPQIGAPAAWQAGYTGKGVPVAVLDTGIDKSHPDLAGQIAGVRNFTRSVETDEDGHGTHVASTIAGTGAAADGKYKGVAPEARLYSGKVCEIGGCPESALLAGMEWAATEIGAKVINLSLGGRDTPELDPLEEAVNRLTAQTGALFVIAAGNSGSSTGAINSPGSADAALTVGAVDKQDELAWFSSRGPRVGDGAIKPDVTAPGVDIVAARSKDIFGGGPGEQYLTLSGTSMATPHTAGMAALLAQQHPDWKAAELKAAITSSAKALDGLSPFEQGSGRIDAARAVRQTVIAEPGSISFGFAAYPHDDDVPVTRTVTYRNLGSTPVTLDLAATMTAPNGAPAPVNAITLDVSTVTVPAGGTAAVRVTSTTRHGGPNGRYLGQVKATAGETVVTTPLTVEKEAEAYTLTIKHLGPDGRPASDGLSRLLSTTDVLFEELIGAPDGTASIRLPKGEYYLEGDHRVEDPQTGVRDVYRFLQPLVQLTSDTEVVLDARTTKKIKITVPETSAVMALLAVGYVRDSPVGPRPSAYLTGAPHRVHTALVGPALPADQLTGYITTQWAEPAGDGSFHGSPYLYSTTDRFPGVFPKGLSRAIQESDLAAVEQTVHATSDRPVELATFGFAEGFGMAISEVLQYQQPVTRRLFLEGGTTTWYTTADDLLSDPGVPIPVYQSHAQTEPATYQAGRQYRQRIKAAVVAPVPEAVRRNGDILSIRLFPTVDADGNIVESLTDTASTTLFRDGEQIGQTERFGLIGAGELPAEKAEYKVVSSLTRPSYARFSTRIDHSWTFVSGATDEAAPLPALGVRFQPPVNAQNVASRKLRTELPVTVHAQAEAQLPALSGAELQVSDDHGKTWQPASLLPDGANGRYKASFATPGGPTVSLKVKLVDADGNVTEQTVIDAFGLA